MPLKFLFIFAPNNSGTTIMSQYLQSQCDGYLPPFGNFEGQRIPTVAPMMRADPWSREMAFDWQFIRAEWTKFAKDAGKAPFVEASPPNIVRVNEIVSAFDTDMKAVFSISNPYLQIASSVKNYATRKVTREVLEEFTRAWLDKARWQVENVMAYGERFPLVKYEDFCRDPELFNRAFGLPVEQSAALQGKKNSKVGTIVEMTPKNVSFLTAFEVETITETLAPDGEILDYFGYALIDFDGYDAMLRNNPALSHAGLLDRFKWELKQVRRKMVP